MTAFTREEMLPRVPDLFRARAEAALRAAEHHTLVYLAAVAERAEEAERGRVGAGVATWEAILNEDPPDCIEEYLRASGWLSDERAVLWRNETMSPGVVVSTILAHEQQVASDRARLGFVCLKLVEDTVDDVADCDCLDYRAAHLCRLRESYDACSFCEDRTNVAQLHGTNLSICVGCASAAIVKLR